MKITLSHLKTNSKYSKAKINVELELLWLSTMKTTLQLKWEAMKVLSNENLHNLFLQNFLIKLRVCLDSVFSQFSVVIVFERNNRLEDWHRFLNTFQLICACSVNWLRMRMQLSGTEQNVFFQAFLNFSTSIDWFSSWNFLEDSMSFDKSFDVVLLFT